MGEAALALLVGVGWDGNPLLSQQRGGGGGWPTVIKKLSGLGYRLRLSK